MRIENSFTPEIPSTVEETRVQQQSLYVNIILNDEGLTASGYLSLDVLKNKVIPYLNAQEAIHFGKSGRIALSIIQSHPFIHLKNYLIGNAKITDCEAIANAALYLENLKMTPIISKNFCLCIEDNIKAPDVVPLDRLMRYFENSLETDVKLQKVFFYFATRTEWEKNSELYSVELIKDYITFYNKSLDLFEDEFENLIKEYAKKIGNSRDGLLDDLKQDRNFVISYFKTFFKDNKKELKEWFQNDSRFFLQAAEKVAFSNLTQIMSLKLRKDIELIRSLSLRNGMFSQLLPSQHFTQEIALKAITTTHNQTCFLENKKLIPASFFEDRNFVREAVGASGDWMSYRLLNFTPKKFITKSMVLNVLEFGLHCAKLLEYIPDNLKEDMDILLAAVNKDFMAWKYVPENLKSELRSIIDAKREEKIRLKIASERCNPLPTANNGPLLQPTLNSTGSPLLPAANNRPSSQPTLNTTKNILAAVNKKFGSWERVPENLKSKLRPLIAARQEEENRLKIASERCNPLPTANNGPLLQPASNATGNPLPAANNGLSLQSTLNVTGNPLHAVNEDSHAQNSVPEELEKKGNPLKRDLEIIQSNNLLLAENNRLKRDLETIQSNYLLLAANNRFLLQSTLNATRNPLSTANNGLSFQPASNVTRGPSLVVNEDSHTQNFVPEELERKDSPLKRALETTQGESSSPSSKRPKSE